MIAKVRSAWPTKWERTLPESDGNKLVIVIGELCFGVSFGAGSSFGGSLEKFKLFKNDLYISSKNVFTWPLVSHTPYRIHSMSG